MTRVVIIGVSIAYVVRLQINFSFFLFVEMQQPFHREHIGAAVAEPISVYRRYIALGAPR